MLRNSLEFNSGIPLIWLHALINYCFKYRLQVCVLFNKSNVTRSYKFLYNVSVKCNQKLHPKGRIFYVVLNVFFLKLLWVPISYIVTNIQVDAFCTVLTDPIERQLQLSMRHSSPAYRDRCGCSRQQRLQLRDRRAPRDAAHICPTSTIVDEAN